MSKITISEALSVRKTLEERHTELVGLRNQNSAETQRYYGANADKLHTVTPKYDVKKLDQLVTRLGREMRILDNAIKKTNATVEVVGYDYDDTVLGELEAVS